jgi:hypothetical protein
MRAVVVNNGVVTVQLDKKIRSLGFWSVIVVIVTGVIAVFLPLDIPEGYTSEHADLVTWLVGAWEASGE